MNIVRPSVIAILTSPSSNSVRESEFMISVSGPLHNEEQSHAATYASTSAVVAQQEPVYAAPVARTEIPEAAIENSHLAMDLGQGMCAQ
jgi:hypothetical protein